jgi:hypothetical protein
VNVTVAVPPQAEGATVLLFEIAALQPPLNVAVFNHVANFASIADCCWQEASVTLTAQLSTTAGAEVTVKDAVQVFGASQELVTVNVTVVDPPHAAGATVELFDSVALHPPVNVVVFNQVVNLELITA